MKLDDKELRHYAASGMAAYLPGMVYMIELMQRELDEMRARLGQLQGTEEGPAGTRGWAGMTPEERSAEMRKRIAVRLRNKKKAEKLHPRDKAHPDHAKWIAKMRRAQKTRFARMTKAEREDWKAKMAAGKKKTKAKAVRKPRKQAPVVLAAAS
jgi:hypothetical protein